MSGFYGDLSPEQDKVLNQLRANIQDVITPRCDDRYLLRFLRARKFDLDKTEKKIRATLEFRKKWGADTILQDWDPPQLMKEYFVDGFLPGLDKGGHAINILNLGMVDLKGLMKCFSKDDIIRYKVYAMERLEQKVKEAREQTGSNLDTITAILDMSGLGTYHLYGPGLNLFDEFMQIEEMHYPEIVHKGLFVNCPRIFNTIYNLVKPFIDPNTKEKLQILGSDYKERLKELFYEDSLLEIHGGKLKKEDAKDVYWGGRIPKELYKENDDSLQHQYVKPGKSFIIEVQVEKAGSELIWEFVTENHDVSFGIHLQVDGKNTPVVPIERVSAHLGNIEGNHTCEKPGLYILEWDNSFSWTKGKNLKYKYELVNPADPDVLDQTR